MWQSKLPVLFVRNIWRLLMLSVLFGSFSCAKEAPQPEHPSVNFGERVHLRHAARTQSPAQKVEHSVTYPPLQIPSDPKTEQFVRQFSKEYRGFIKAGLSRKQQYESTITAVFSRYGLPHELVNIAFVESQFRPTAKNNSGATGLWQFMPQTAKAYGLSVSKKRDERLDVLRSTIAVAEYLKDLYERYEDWNFVLAAYHAGHGAIDAIQKKAGDVSYSRLAKAGRIPESTEDFVSRVLAITKICNDLPAYGFVEEGINVDRNA